jgi:hypothetical protein
MRIAYIVLAHTAPHQLCRLVERLDGDHARFLIHIDRRAPRDVYEHARRRLATNHRAQFLRRRASRRCTFGQVAAPLDAMRVLVGQAQPFDYAILLTGQDYPLKSNGAIVDLLECSRGACFLHAFPMLDPQLSDWGPTEVLRYRNWHMWLNGLHVRIRLNRRIPGGLEPYGGSAYWGLSSDAVRYVSQFVERRPRVVRFFRHVYDPDEILFQTVLMNSPLRDRVTSLPGRHCYGLHYIDWSGRDEHPKTLDISDLPELRSTPALFARKFDRGTDGRILDVVDDALLARPEARD